MTDNSAQSLARIEQALARIERAASTLTRDPRYDRLRAHAQDALADLDAVIARLETR